MREGAPATSHAEADEGGVPRYSSRVEIIEFKDNSGEPKGTEVRRLTELNLGADHHYDLCCTIFLPPGADPKAYRPDQIIHETLALTLCNSRLVILGQ